MAGDDFSPFISVVIPVYNGSNYLAQAIDSALAQTYKNVEVIVVNDGSDDGGKTREIALSYGSRIRYFEKENGGVATALNLGIERMRGEYLAWLSHDDEFLPHKLVDQVELLRGRGDRDEVVLFSDFTVHNVSTGAIYDANSLDPSRMESGPCYRWLLALFASTIHGCTSLIPKKCLDRIGPFDPRQRTTQDYDYYCRMLKAGVKFVYQGKSLIVTRHHEAQDTRRILDTHLQELRNYFSCAIELFAEELASYDFVFVEQFLNILKARGQTDAYVKLFNVWNASQCAKDAPPLWLYWECPSGRTIPDYIYLCWKSIALHCCRDFRVTVLTPSNLDEYLPNIDPCYKSLAKIAHRADFVRFNLLAEYGGVWLDSDVIVFRSLRQVMTDIKSSGFAAMGYYKDNDGDFFPSIAFLAAEKNNEIAREMAAGMKATIRRLIEVEGRQPEWDEIGGYLLCETMKRATCGYVFYDAMQYFTLLPYWNATPHWHEHNNLSSLYRLIHPLMFGQVLTNSIGMDTLVALSEEQILRDQTLMISNLFRISFSGVQQTAPIAPEAAPSDSPLPDSSLPDSSLPDSSPPDSSPPDSSPPDSSLGLKEEIRVELRKVPFLRPVYHKIYKPPRMLAAKIARGVRSRAAWRRLLSRALSAAQAGIRCFRKADPAKEAFTQAYKLNIWNCPESRSGEGSTVTATRVIREHLPALMEKYEVEKFLDLPCGDFNWMQHVRLEGKQYIGGDIVRELVESNRARFGGKSRKFICVNLIDGKLPKADMILCRDCLIHLSFEDINAVLKNLHKSGIQYLLTNTYPGRVLNCDVNTGQFRPINLQAEPFNFPEPLWIANEQCTEAGGLYADKSLALWAIADLPRSLSVLTRREAA